MATLLSSCVSYAISKLPDTTALARSFAYSILRYDKLAARNVSSGSVNKLVADIEAIEASKTQVPILLKSYESADVVVIEIVDFGKGISNINNFYVPFLRHYGSS